MKKIIKLLLFVGCLIISERVTAQTPVYSRHYLGDGKNKPFDKEYDLMIPFNQQEALYYIHLYKHKGKKSFLQSLQKEKGTISTAILNGSWDKIRDTVFLKVEFRYDADQKVYSLLKPSKAYSIIVFKGLTPGSENIIASLRNEYNATGTVSINGMGYNQYVAQRTRQAEANKIVTYADDFNRYIKFYEEELRPLEDSLSNSKGSDRGFAIECERIRLPRINCIGNLIKLFNGQGCLKVPVKCIDTCDILKSVLKLEKFSCENILAFIKGKTSLHSIELVNQYLPDNKYMGRRATIEKNIDELKEIQEVVQQILLQVEGDSCMFSMECLAAINRFLENLIIASNISRSLIVDVIRRQNEITLAIEESRLFIDYSITDVNTYVYNFQARNEMAITPVFGYAYYGFQNGFNGFIPYLGFQINFSGVNREDPFSQIHRKTLWQRLCFTTAWTLTTIEEKNKRHDLFNKSSLITSLGFKLGHIAMLNFGGLWFKSEDPNQLVSKKNISITPTLALSVNLEIEKLLNGFTKLIPIK